MWGGGALGVLAGPLGGLVGENLHVLDGTGVGGDEHEESSDTGDDGRVAHLTEVLQLVKHRLLAGENNSRQRSLLSDKEEEEKEEKIEETSIRVVNKILTSSPNPLKIIWKVFQSKFQIVGSSIITCS